MKFRCLVWCLVLWLQGCTSPWQQLVTRAEHQGVVRSTVQGEPFTHTIFVRQAATGADTVTVFIEGDGLPWRAGGWEPSDDPRPQHALAFELFVSTPGTVWYLTRPCYDASLADARCRPVVWTDARYSEQNVASMAAALRSFSAQHHVQHLQLVGYSGGGVLAVLLAARLPQVVRVVTLAANLDTTAWAQAKQYSPMVGSLNPATDLPAMTAPHVAVHGMRDEVVPLATLDEFARRHPATQWLRMPDYDHVCCWQRDWQNLWPQLSGAVTGAAQY